MIILNGNDEWLLENNSLYLLTPWFVLRLIIVPLLSIRWLLVGLLEVPMYLEKDC